MNRLSNTEMRFYLTVHFESTGSISPTPRPSVDHLPHAKGAVRKSSPSDRIDTIPAHSSCDGRQLGPVERIAPSTEGNRLRLENRFRLKTLAELSIGRNSGRRKQNSARNRLRIPPKMPLAYESRLRTVVLGCKPAYVCRSCSMKAFQIKAGRDTVTFDLMAIHWRFLPPESRLDCRADKLP
jgi:hypothetical protein